MMFRRITALLLLIVFSTCAVSAASHVAEPYSEDEFPTWTIDLRNSEIVTLGSLPFSTLGVTLGYSLIRYIGHGFSSDYLPNPLAKSSSAANLNAAEQKGIFITSGIISLIIGIVDYVLSRMERNSQQAQEEQTRQLQFSDIEIEAAEGD